MKYIIIFTALSTWFFTYKGNEFLDSFIVSCLFGAFLFGTIGNFNIKDEYWQDKKFDK